MFVSSRDDLAVIRFTADEDLSVVEIADADPAKDDRILCVGNPENEWFAVSYGQITSGMEKLGESTGHPSNAMKHFRYIDSPEIAREIMDKALTLEEYLGAAS